MPLTPLLKEKGITLINSFLPPSLRRRGQGDEVKEVRG